MLSTPFLLSTHIILEKNNRDQSCRDLINKLSPSTPIRITRNEYSVF